MHFYSGPLMHFVSGVDNSAEIHPHFDAGVGSGSRSNRESAPYRETAVVAAAPAHRSVRAAGNGSGAYEIRDFPGCDFGSSNPRLRPGSWWGLPVGCLEIEQHRRRPVDSDKKVGRAGGITGVREHLRKIQGAPRCDVGGCVESPQRVAARVRPMPPATTGNNGAIVGPARRQSLASGRVGSLSPKGPVSILSV